MHIKKYSVLFFISLIFLFSSCEKQAEQTENRDKIIGQWSVVEYEASANEASAEIRNLNLSYFVNITRSEVFADEAYIYNFFEIGEYDKVPAYVDGNQVIISKIELEDHVFRGSGTISEDHQTIEWTYWVEGPYDDHEIEYRATYTFRK